MISQLLAQRRIERTVQAAYPQANVEVRFIPMFKMVLIDIEIAGDAQLHAFDKAEDAVDWFRAERLLLQVSELQGE